MRGERLILQQSTAHANTLAGARRQAGKPIQVRATRHVLHMGAQGRAHVASTSHILHNMLLSFATRCRPLILAEALRPEPCTSVIHTEAPSPDSCSAGPVIGVRSGAQRVFHLLGPRKQTRSIYDTRTGVQRMFKHKKKLFFGFFCVPNCAFDTLLFIIFCLRQKDRFTKVPDSHGTLSLS